MSTILEKIAGIESEVCVLFWPERRLCALWYILQSGDLSKITAP